MKKNYHISVFVAIATVIHFTGCKKNSTSSTTYKVKTETINGTVYTNTYDQQGRLLQQSGGGQVNTYAYPPDSVIIYQSNPAASPQNDTVIYLLNSAGLAYSYPWGRTQYVYDGQKHLLSTYTPVDTINCTYSSGNCTVFTNTLNENGYLYITTQYQFYTNTFDSQDYGQPYFGAQSNDLMSYYISIKPITVDTVNYAYTFDNLNRVVTQTRTSGGNIIDTRSYTYY